MTVATILALPAELDPAGWSVPIGGDSALCRAVAAVYPLGPVAVAAAEDHAQLAWNLLSSHGFGDAMVLPVPGDADRARCLRSALAYVTRPPLCAGEVLVHDVRYLLASAALAARVAHAVPAADYVVPTVAMTDSVKVLGAQGVVGGNVDRADLVTVGYPRGYSAEALARELGGDDLTATATTVEGDPDAFAVDLVRDAALVEAILTRG